MLYDSDRLCDTSRTLSPIVYDDTVESCYLFAVKDGTSAPLPPPTSHRMGVERPCPCSQLTFVWSRWIVFAVAVSFIQSELRFV